MRQLSAFLRKEGMEFIRTGKIWILLIIFILFGIMNPAIAKLTPWMVETMSDSLAESGMVLTEVKVNAMTSWNQFYKNISMALIIFALMLSGILTTEYQKGTLVNMLTKGLVRWKVVGAKPSRLSVCGQSAIGCAMASHTDIICISGIIASPRMWPLRPCASICWESGSCS